MTATTVRTRRLRLAATTRHKWIGAAFAVPALALFGAFAIYPMARVFYISFFDYDLTSSPRWVGLHNYRYLFDSSDFHATVRETLFYVTFTYVPAIVLALVLGVAIAAVTSSEAAGNNSVAQTPGEPTAAPETPAFSVPATPTPTRRSPKPTKSVSATPTATATTSATPAATTTTAPLSDGTLTLSPSSGPRGSRITVTGSGWAPGVPVTVRYTGTLATSTDSVTANKHGAFTAHVTANGALPGSYTVSADNCSQSASQKFRQTT